MTGYEKEEKSTDGRSEAKILGGIRTADGRFEADASDSAGTDGHQRTDRSFWEFFIQPIDVHNNHKSSSHCSVNVDIYFAVVRMIDIPTEKGNRR